MISLENNKHLLYGVRIIFEKKEIDNQCESHKWIVNDLIPLDVTSGEGYPPINDVKIRPLLNDVSRHNSDNKNLFKATVSVSGWKQFFTNKTVPKYYKTLSSFSNQLRSLLSNE